MIEVTVWELVFFAAAVLATAKWFYWRGEAKKGVHILRLMVEDSDARAKIIEGYEQFKKENV